MYYLYIDRTFHLPGIKAPNSVIQFWIKRLKITDTTTINIYAKEHGYSSVEEIQADILGWYRFYGVERFVFTYNIFIIYLLYIIYIFIIYFIYRYQSLVDKHDNLPILDAKSKQYKKRFAIEYDVKHCEILWNTGLGASYINTGNLGLESTNAFIGMYVYYLYIFYLYIMYLQYIYYIYIYIYI